MTFIYVPNDFELVISKAYVGSRKHLVSFESQYKIKNKKKSNTPKFKYINLVIII